MLEIFKNKTHISQEDWHEPKSKHYKFNILKDRINTISFNEEYKNIIYYPSSKEWFSSIYAYNKSYVKSLIVYDTTLNNLLGSYANKLKSTITRFRRRRNNKIRYSSNKLFTSKAELKHTNIKLLALAYLFNKNKFMLHDLLLKDIYNLYLFDKKKIKDSAFNKKTKYDKGITILRYMKKGFCNIRSFKFNYFYELINNILFKTTYNILKYITEKNALTANSIPYIDNSKNIFKEDTVLDTSIDLNFNKVKFNSSSLNQERLGILKLLKKIYGKKVLLRVVDLKSLHLNSDIYSSAVALKLRDRHNKAVRILSKAIIQMVKIPDLHTLITFDDNKPFMNKTNVLNTINQQVVSGVRFEASGRLTKRLTAMRAVFKYKYVGTLKNIRSSFNNKPSTILRGVLKSNGQYTLINSKTRNGTFGLKG
jgi:hypothetical protein